MGAVGRLDHVRDAAVVELAVDEPAERLAHRRAVEDLAELDRQTGLELQRGVADLDLHVRQLRDLQRGARRLAVRLRDDPRDVVGTTRVTAPRHGHQPVEQLHVGEVPRRLALHRQPVGADGAVGHEADLARVLPEVRLADREDRARQREPKGRVDEGQLAGVRLGVGETTTLGHGLRVPARLRGAGQGLERPEGRDGEVAEVLVVALAVDDGGRRRLGLHDLQVQPDGTGTDGRGPGVGARLRVVRDRRWDGVRADPGALVRAQACTVGHRDALRDVGAQVDAVVEQRRAREHAVVAHGAAEGPRLVLGHRGLRRHRQAQAHEGGAGDGRPPAPLSSLSCRVLRHRCRPFKTVVLVCLRTVGRPPAASERSSRWAGSGSGDRALPRWGRSSLTARLPRRSCGRAAGSAAR